MFHSINALNLEKTFQVVMKTDEIALSEVTSNLVAIYRKRQYN